MNYYVKGNVTTDSLFVEDNCNENLTEFYCYYNGSEFEAKNESYECAEGCSNGTCNVPQCTSNDNCTVLNLDEIASCNNPFFEYAPASLSESSPKFPPPPPL